MMPSARADARSASISAEAAELDRDRQAVGEELADGEIAADEARAEIALQQIRR